MELTNTHRATKDDFLSFDNAPLTLPPALIEDLTKQSEVQAGQTPDTWDISPAGEKVLLVPNRPVVNARETKGA